MRTLIGSLIVALLVMAVGEAVRRAAHIEQQLAQAEADLATLSPDTADADYLEVEKEIGVAGRLPFIGPPMLADVRKERAMVAYWRGNYSGVPSNEAELAADDTSPDLVFLAGNAAYRSVVGKHVGQQGAQELDGVLRFYTMLLKKDPTHADAAYNYEYIVRLRNVVAKTKSSGAKGEAPKSDDTAPSVHGEEGSPPQDTPPEQFNVIVPLRPDERGDLMKAGTGAVRQRKG